MAESNSRLRFKSADEKFFRILADVAITCNNARELTLRLARVGVKVLQNDNKEVLRHWLQKQKDRVQMKYKRYIFQYRREQRCETEVLAATEDLAIEAFERDALPAIDFSSRDDTSDDPGEWEIIEVKD